MKLEYHHLKPVFISLIITYTHTQINSLILYQSVLNELFMNYGSIFFKPKIFVIGAKKELKGRS